MTHLHIIKMNLTIDITYNTYQLTILYLIKALQLIVINTIINIYN